MRQSEQESAGLQRKLKQQTNGKEGWQSESVIYRSAE